MPAKIPEVKPLSHEEREYLEGQGELILEKMAALDEVLAQIGGALADAEGELCKARMEVERLKGLRTIAIERGRNYKAIIGKF